MKRHMLSRRFYVVIAALATGDAALLVLSLNSTDNDRAQQSISEANGIPTPIITTRNSKEQQLVSSWSEDSLANLGSLSARFAKSSQSNSQGKAFTSGTIETVTPSSEWAAPTSGSLYNHTAIGAVIESNGGRIPATGEELQHALQKLGDFAQLPIPFSAVALDSGLSHPRVVLAQRPANVSASIQGPARAKTPASKSVSDLLGNTPANKPNLMGRLYLAANMEVSRDSNNPRVKTVEFISWNSQFMRFDFGVIEGMGEVPSINFVDGIRCVTCHKNKGPILGDKPWSNTTQDHAILSASTILFANKSQPSIDGMTLLTPQATEVDAAVRMGADLLHNRKIFRALIQAPRGREVFTLLLRTIVQPGSLETLDEKIKPQINGTELTRFMFDAIAINKAVQPSTLIDFNPGESLGGPRMGWCGDSNLVATYDANRAEGKHGLTGQHLPSNPKAFLKSPIRQVNLPSDLISAVMLARTLGLTEGDRKLLAETLNSAAKSASNLQVDSAAIARHIFNGPTFSDVLNSGNLPDRDDFKDRFLAGLRDSLKANNISAEFLPLRERYASGPRYDKTISGHDSEFELTPTTSCLRCHDIGIAGRKMQTGPIPLLAFDPFDKTSRQAWIGNADNKKKEIVLSRMLKRIGNDEDMPPEDSLEYKMFRVKNPASFEEVKQFLKAELKKVRGD